MNPVEGNLKPTFGGHEKFPFRYGWLKKGVDAAGENPAIFTADQALVDLGVGRNMVRSIRHWCLATDLLKEARRPDSLHGLEATPLGTKLLARDGWDPYLEDVATLWLLHWQLVSNRVRALVWHLTFSSYFEIEFTRKQLTAFIGRQLERSGIATTSGTVEREVDVCLRSYVPAIRSSATGISEESLECPLAELGLLYFVPEDGIYRFGIGPKATLPPAIFGYALLVYLSKAVGSRRTVAVEECMYKPGSPGQAFKLDENSVVGYLESLELLTQGHVRLAETAGLRQLYLQNGVNGLLQNYALELLDNHYGRSRHQS